MARPKKQNQVPPQGTIRRSQMVTTYGPGSMIDLVDQAALVGGLDFWAHDRKKGDPVIVEPRLRDSLAKRLRAVGRELSTDKAFKEPPVGDDREPSRYAGVQVLEFPRWFVCQNPKCRSLQRKDGLELKRERYWHGCGPGGRSFECVPVRFLGACRRGHCQEYPWVLFAHLGQDTCAAPSLSFTEGATGDFGEVSVQCACGARQQLASAMPKGPEKRTPFTCGGHRPWLGFEASEDCDEHLRLLVRTASNSYFSQVVSALSVPEPGRELDDAVQTHWGTLQVASAATLPAFRQIPDLGAAIAEFSDEQVLKAVEAKKSDSRPEREPLRTAEFKQLVSSPLEKPGERPPPDEDFFARRVTPKGGLPAGVERVVLASKLREVRAQIGFTRLEAPSPDIQGEFDLKVTSAPLGLATNWLPATEILGEGVFIQLEEAAVREWAERDAVKARTDELRRGFEQWRGTLDPKAQDNAPSFLGARYYLLHSLSHLLISAISLECGYSASAIRERIYCGPSTSDPNTPMAAILLSTGSSGTEGTLGGLVEQGRKIRGHLARAWELGRLCANDPVCASHSPADDPAERYLEGAGCHGCLFIAETSCERFNRMLDRGLVVPTVGRPSELAFFRERP